MADIFHFDELTGAYLGTTLARLDPIDQLPLVPANATQTAPPEVAELQIAVWDGAAWTIAPDHRGVTYWTPEGEEVLITEIGVEPPTEALDQAPPPSIDDLREEALRRMRVRREQFIAQFTAGVSPSEVASWPGKAAAARAHTLASPQPIILEEAAITGETPEALAATIIAKADLYEKIIARVTGLRRQIEDQIAAAATSAEIEAALSAAQTKATEMATELGVSFPTTAT